jgi:spore germination protein (amino acid permease)
MIGRGMMIKEGKFGTLEAISLTTLVLITKAFYTSIRVLIVETSTAAWYATLISCAVSIILFLFVYLLMKRFPGKDLVCIFDLVTGRFIGKILSLIFCGYFIYYSGSNIREFVEMIKAYILPYTQPSFIIFIMVGIAIVYAFIGLEGIARMAYHAIYFVLICVLLILILPFPFYNADYLFPIAGYGFVNTAIQGFWRGSAYSDVIFLAFIINSIYGVKNFRKIGVISLVISGVTISLTIICGLMAFEYPQANENMSSLYQLSRIIYFNRFFQRVESIFIFIWVMASIITVSLAFYISVSIFCKAFKVPKHGPTLFPLAFITFMVSLLPQSLSETIEKNIIFIRQYSMLITYLIPILVLLIAVIRGKKGDAYKNEEV